MIQWLRRETNFVMQKPLDKREMLAALRVSDSDPLWRAVLQMIEEELAQVRAVATASVKDHGILASWVGGMEALERLRSRLIQDRQTAIGK